LRKFINCLFLIYEPVPYVTGKRRHTSSSHSAQNAAYMLVQVNRSINQSIKLVSAKPSRNRTGLAMQRFVYIVLQTG